MQPTLTQVPPRPHFEPIGDGCTKSASPTFFPSFAAVFAALRPPEPPPITNKSKS